MSLLGHSIDYLYFDFKHPPHILIIIILHCGVNNELKRIQLIYSNLESSYVKDRSESRMELMVIEELT